MLLPLHLPSHLPASPPICPHPHPEHGGLQQFSFLGSFPPSPPGSSGRHGSAISPSGGGCCCASTGEICQTRRVGPLDREPGFEHLSPFLTIQRSLPLLSCPHPLLAPLAVSRLFVAAQGLLLTKPHVKVQTTVIVSAGIN